jgi:predicted transposase/invertase (TIGR01784 family)
MDIRSKTIDQLTLFDDAFFSWVLKEKKDAAHLLISAVIGFDDFEIHNVEIQKELMPGYPGGKKVKLDVLAKDKTGRNFNVEIQNIARDFGPGRARYYGAAADLHMLEAGQDYGELKDRYTIIFLGEDPKHPGIPVRTYRYMEVNSGTPLNDGSCIIYVNGSYQNDDAIGHLIADMHQSDPDKMHYPVLAKGTGYFKKETEGREKIMGVIEELINEAVKEKDWQLAQKDQQLVQKDQQLVQKDREIQQQKKETEEVLALRMIDSGISLQQVSEITSLPVEELSRMTANRF